MGFFDFLKRGTTEGKIENYAKKVRKKDTPVEERQACCEWLAEEGSTDAILALLGRFEMTYEHGMKDAQEKERVERLVLGLGDRAIDPLETFVRSCKSFSRPLKLYERLAGKDAAKTIVLELVDVEFAKSGLKPAKKRDLLVKLADFRGPDVVESATRFVDDFDAASRYNAVEVLLAQPDTDAIRDLLVARLADPEEDSGRLKFKIGEAAAGRRWPLGDHADAVAAEPPNNFKVHNGLLVPG
jgi:hypothetical protein